MTKNDYYHSSAEFTSETSWNEPGPSKEIIFEVCVSQTLSRNTTVTTSNYSVKVNYDEDDYHKRIDTSGTDWKEAYRINRMTPLKLIEELKSFLEKTLPDLIASPKEYGRAKYLIEECEGWVEDDFEVVKE